MKTIAFRDHICFLLLLILISLVCLYNHPMFNDMTEVSGLEKGSVLSPFINISFVLLFLLSFRREAFHRYYALRVFSIFIVIVFFSLLVASVFFSISPLNEIRLFLIPLASLLIGCNINLTKSQFRFISTWFLIIIAYVAIMQITINIGAFIIEDRYLVDNKNALGIVIGTGVILAFILALEGSSNKWLKVFYLVVAFFLLYCDLTIRARAASLTAIFLCLYVYYLRNGSKRLVYTIVTVSLLFLIVLLLAPSVFEYLYASIFSGHEGGDVTSDRMVRNAGAISAIMNDPFFCKLSHDYGVHQVHNFFLKTWYEKGLVFGWPILLMYVYQFIGILKSSFQKYHNNLYCSIGFILVLYPFINSLVETTLPYGPGTDTVINFIFWGIACRQLADEGYLKTYLSESQIVNNYGEYESS